MLLGGRSLVVLAVALTICFLVAAVGARVTAPQIPTWYAGLNKPSWTPPRLAFPIVWPMLYLLMAIAVWRFWEAPSSDVRTAVLCLFAVQLALNAIWSPVFFGMHALSYGLVVILLLDVSVAATIAVGFRVDAIGSYLLLPYLAWIAFATALNARILSLN